MKWHVFLYFKDGILKWMLVRARDATIYHLAIRPRGRIPASEGCFVKRIAGPGLNTEFYYQVHSFSFFFFFFKYIHLYLWAVRYQKSKL